MRVSVITTAEFLALAAMADRAVLRIHDPIDPREPVPAGWGIWLGLSFWDMEAGAMGWKGRLAARLWGRHPALFSAVAGGLMADGIPFRPFLAADAEAIAAFADSLGPLGIQEVLVVCRNGRGRSSTIGRWLARRLDACFSNDGWDRDSRLINSTLERVAGASYHPLRRAA